MTSFGKVMPEKDEPWFHADWERRALAITLAMGRTGSWNIDQSRHARETLAPRQYWSSSYYEIWIAGLEKLMQERGLVSAEEIAGGRSLAAAKPVKQKLMAGEVAAILAKGGPSSRPSNAIQRFQPGDRVKTSNMAAWGHTRLPGYAQNKQGEIILVHGTHVFPDHSAKGLGDDPQWLYTVRFTAKELWGHETKDIVNIDLWDPYLEKVP